MSRADDWEKQDILASLVNLNVRTTIYLLQVVAEMPWSTDAKRSPAAVILSTGLAWAAVTLSASAADLSNGTYIHNLLSVTILIECKL